MDWPNRQLLASPWRLDPQAPSSPSAIPVPLDPDSDPDSPISIISDDHYIYDGVRWYVWDRNSIKYVPPSPKDLPSPPKSLVDPHTSIDDAGERVPSIEYAAQSEYNRSFPLLSSTSPANMSGAGFGSTPFHIGQEQAPPKSPTASCILSCRDVDRQIEYYAYGLQKAAKAEDQNVIMERLMCKEPATRHAVRLYYRKIAATRIRADRKQDEQLERERDSKGMVYGSELVRRQTREERGDEGKGWPQVETEVE